LNKSGLLFLTTASLFFLAGCDTRLGHIGRAPDMSNIELSNETVPEANSVKVPLPDPKMSPPEERADASSLWENGNDSLFGDQRAAEVGDILTVNINISDRASLSNQTARSRNGNEAINPPTVLGYESRLDEILPGINPEDLPEGNLIDLGSTSSSSGQGSVDRNEDIELKVAAMVIDSLPNGNFVIAGRQEVRVNYELRELRVAGVIRPEDITKSNSIEYDKIAEARISYGGKGQLTDVQQPRYGQQVMDVILPW
jgi:flagellar L-ring protein precursor FlgH